MNINRQLPWAAGVVTLGVFGVVALQGAPRDELDVDALGALPLLEGGRVKPVDSLARNTLLVIRGQQEFRHQGTHVSAVRWLLDVMVRPDVAADYPVFVINDPDVLGMVGIRQSSQRYFSFRTLRPFLPQIQKEALTAHDVDAKKRTRFQGAVVNLFDRLYLYHRAQSTLRLAKGPDLSSELADLHAPRSDARHRALSELSLFRLFPSPTPADPEAWRNVGEALTAAATGGSVDPGLPLVAALEQAYRNQDPSTFNRAVEQLRTRAELPPAAVRHARWEVAFNRAQPFYVGMQLYVLALLIAFVSWMWRPGLLRPTAFTVLGVALLVHTLGLVLRVVLQGRPPVTNLYSSAVFVGWGAVVVGALLERWYRNGFGTAVAGGSGFASLIVAHHLARDGDTMEMMRAVLDSNFWLATHVVTITIGYSGTFLAGALAVAYTLRKHLTSTPDEATTKSLVGMTYGVVCFSLLLSFVGTVLGGIWADQSWGRFWGWDPKENGALLIVLWNAVILHARWGGYVRERGIMVMALFGNVITSLSWFGVNMLGVGLHSYGFMDRAFFALSAFIGSQLVLMAVCAAPPRFRREPRKPASLAA